MMEATEKRNTVKQEAGILRLPMVVSALLLITSTLARWPHFFYVTMRWMVCGTAIYAIWHCSRNHHRVWALVLGIIAVIFNPIFRVEFASNSWHATEFIAALIFAISAVGLGADAYQHH